MLFFCSPYGKKLEPCYFLLSCDPWGENPVNKKVERIFFILEQKSKLCSVINRQPCLRRGLKEDGCYRNSKLQFPSVIKQGIFWTSKTYSITSNVFVHKLWWGVYSRILATCQTPAREGWKSPKLIDLHKLDGQNGKRRVGLWKRQLVWVKRRKNREIHVV